MTAATPRTVEEYLDLLRAELQGADRALVQDALYDAEEHLRAELAQHPEETDATMLGRIVASYGAPSEVADAYRSNETRVQAALPTPPPKPTHTTLGRFFGVYSDPRAYLGMAYMLLALATGIFYFTFAVTGLSLSAGFAILIIGIPFFLLFIGTTRVLALAERMRADGVRGFDTRDAVFIGLPLQFQLSIENWDATPGRRAAVDYDYGLPGGIRYRLIDEPVRAAR